MAIILPYGQYKQEKQNNQISHIFLLINHLVFFNLNSYYLIILR